jgi:hypothetical protein
MQQTHYPKHLLRLGLTESTLLACFVNDLINETNEMVKKEHSLVQWLLTTSGYYDDSVQGNAMHFNVHEATQSPIFNAYFNRLIDICKSGKYDLHLCFHKGITPEMKQILFQFFKTTPAQNINTQMRLPAFINQNCRILIINNIASLMKEQFENGNAFKANPHFPTNVKSIIAINTLHIIANQGPHHSILETADFICNQIKQQEHEFDGCIVSVGAYSALIADFIVTELHKEVYVIGGELHGFFGIKNNRNKLQNTEPWFVTVPENLKPENYKLVENGCYW